MTPKRQIAWLPLDIDWIHIDDLFISSEQNSRKHYSIQLLPGQTSKILYDQFSDDFRPTFAPKPQRDEYNLIMSKCISS